MSLSFASIFKHRLMELKGKIRVTDALLKELFSRQILMQQNVDDIKVSPYVVETNVLLKLS